MRNLTLGVEFEVPTRKGGKYLADEGYTSNDLHREIDGFGSPHIPRETETYHYNDPTVGAEIVSEPLHYGDIDGWYRDMWDFVERMGYYVQPCGQLADANTAGMHIHMSEMSKDKMEWLYEESRAGWLQTFVCSSPTDSDPKRVFRGKDYCSFGDMDRRYSVVNRRSRAGKHYEWRLPEPSIPRHMQHITGFLSRLHERGTDAAKEYAINKMKKQPDEITAIRRYKECRGGSGLIKSVSKDANGGNHSWFDTMRSDTKWADPLSVTLEDGTELYAIYTPMQSDKIGGCRGVVPTHTTGIDGMVGLVYADDISGYYGEYSRDIAEMIANGDLKEESQNGSAVSFIENTILK